jgi:hypothetical protein
MHCNLRPRPSGAPQQGGCWAPGALHRPRHSSMRLSIINDLRAQRDSWQAQAERLAITAQARPSSATSVPTVVVQRRSWLPWRRSA